MSSAETSAEEVRPEWLALAAAAVTAVLLFTPVADAPGSVFIGGACLFWTGFVIAWSRRDRAAFRRWGFRADNLWQASALTAAAFAAAAAGLAGYAAVRGTLRFPLHALPLFLVYPLWGLTQQFLMLGVVTRNLERVGGLGRRPAVLVVVVALLFGLLHAFNLRLVVATFLLELVAVPLYLRHRNLWPLGVAHGWLGGLFYLWVEGRDLWVERFG
jgi:Type II CAAX prenyl endopeptidase Rce1-like